MAITLGKNNSGAAEFSSVGHSIPRVEARAKVTGKAEYVHNLRLPGMLYGRIHRSTVAHARLLSVDVAAAQAMPGVYAVYTAADIIKLIPEPFYGPAFHDQPILAIDKVHYVGEPVALVLAADPHVAEAAAQAQAGDTVLLAPACASFDQFSDFEARGRAFVQAVEALA